jgi:YggT family protein
MRLGLRQSQYALDAGLLSAAGPGHSSGTVRLRTDSRAASFRCHFGDFAVLEPLFWLIERLIYLYTWAVILAAVFSMLTAFGVLDTRNRVVWTIGDFLYRLTEPALRPIRNLLPNFGNIDISPVILILLLQAAVRLVEALGRNLGICPC